MLACVLLHLKAKLYQHIEIGLSECTGKGFGQIIFLILPLSYMEFRIEPSCVCWIYVKCLKHRGKNV